MLHTTQDHPGISQTALGEITGIDRATLATMIRRLEERGLIAREIDPTNRRRRQLTLTEAGVHTVEQIRPLTTEVDEAMLGGMSVPQCTALLDALRLLSWREQRRDS